MYTTWLIIALISIQTMLNFLQNGRCSFIFRTHLVDTTDAAIVTKKQFLFSSQFSLPYFTLTCSQNHLYNYQWHSLTFSNFPRTSLCVQTSQQSTPKIFSLPQTFCQFRLRQSTKELGSILWNDTVSISPFVRKVWTVLVGLTHNHWFFIAQT